MKLSPGQRVREGSTTGVVVALRPQGMVDVKLGSGLVKRRSASALVRVNPVYPRSSKELEYSKKDKYTLIRLLGTANDNYEYFRRRRGKDEVRSLHEHYWEDEVDLLSEMLRQRPNPKGKFADVEDPEREQLRRVMLAVYRGLVEKGAAEGRETESKAWAIATSQLQKHGYLVPGTGMPTLKGIVRSRQKLSTSDAHAKRQAYEHLLASTRKVRGYRVMEVAPDTFVVEPGGRVFYSEGSVRKYLRDAPDLTEKQLQLAFSEASRAEEGAKRAEKMRTKSRKSTKRDAKGRFVAVRNPARKLRRNHHLAPGDAFKTSSGKKGRILGLAQGGKYPVRWSDGTYGWVKDAYSSARKANPKKWIPRPPKRKNPRGSFVERVPTKLYYSAKDDLYLLSCGHKVARFVTEHVRGWKRQKSWSAGSDMVIYVTTKAKTAQETAALLNTPVAGAPRSALKLPAAERKPYTRETTAAHGRYATTFDVEDPEAYRQQFKHGKKVRNPGASKKVRNPSPTITVRKVAGGYQATVKGLYLPQARTTESFKAKIQPTRSEARMQAHSEIRKILSNPRKRKVLNASW